MNAVMHPSPLQVVIAIVAIVFWTTVALLAARGVGTTVTTAEHEQATDPDFPTPVPAGDRPASATPSLDRYL